MRMGSALGALWRNARRVIWETVYPEGAVCAACGRISAGECLCPACREELLHSEVLESWETRNLGSVQAWSMRPHRGVARELVLRLKHGTEARAAKELAGMLAQRPDWVPAPPPGTVVTWVPTPKGRVRERCIDHGEALAKAVAEESGLACRPLLRRIGHDRPQARLNRAQREANLKNAFEPVEEIDTPVLLVDDVLTTGTTATRCIEALRRGGAREITVLTVTRAVR